MVEVLERLGCETVLPEKQICCGQPTYNSGYSKASIKTFKNEIDALLSIDADYIVGPSGSCVFMIKEYKDIFKDQNEIEEDFKGYINLSYGLKILNGNGTGNINPKADFMSRVFCE